MLHLYYFESLLEQHGICYGFQVLGKSFMDYGIKGGKCLSLGMPKAPQDIQ